MEDFKRRGNGDAKAYNGKKTREEVKIICLGDSATGKSKLMERFLLNKYKSNQQASTFALNLHKYETEIDDDEIIVDFWDTAGQERFEQIHPSYYHEAHTCILIFDVTRKITYMNLDRWYKELRTHRPEIPCFVAANKIDENSEATNKTFAFSEKHNLPLHYVSAADGTNVVRLFREAIKAAVSYKKNPTDFTDQILNELRLQMSKES